MNSDLVFPMAAHVALCTLLYLLLTIARAPAIWGIGRGADGSNPWAKVEPRIGANLSNQFEWPLLFHAACLVLMLQGRVEPLQVWLAWAFIAGRYLHSAAQVGTSNVRLRGVVFTVNFVAVLAMWALIVRGNS